MLKRQVAITVISLFLFCSTALALDGAEYVPDNLPKTVVFHGATLEKAFTEAKDNVLLVEYIPKGESLERWSTMFAIRKMPIPATPLKYAMAIAKTATQRNPKLGANVHFKKETPEQAMVTFIAVGGGIVEYNLWKIMKLEGCDELISYQYAVRNYGELSDDFRNFLGNPDPVIDAMRDYKL